MTDTDYRYFQRRAAEERAAAASAVHPVARRSHLELAERYRQAAELSTATILRIGAASGR
ncbi:MAG: hypothetical protein ACJ8FT_11105 [Sphingomonas sp.]